MTFDTIEVKRLTPEMRREQTRQLLIDAAAVVFAARGYHDASLAEIADAAGYTTGAIYSNFGSKEDLFLAVVEARRTAMFEAFFSIDHTAESAERINAIADVYRRLATNTADWALWQEFTLYALRNPQAREKLSADLDLTVSSLIDLLGEHDDTVSADSPITTEELARLYIAVFEGVGRQRAIQPNAVPDDLFASLVNFIGDAVANSAPSPRTARHRQRPARQAPERT